MHIMEGFLPLQWCIVWWVIALPCLILGIYQLKKVVDLDREALPLLGVTGGFIFILSSLKLPSVTGSCSHPTGTGLSTISFGPWITAVVCAIVLVFQSLFLAHGGLSVLGANIVSMGIVGPLVGYGVYRVLRNTSINIYITVFLVCALADLFTYVMTSLELALAYPAETRRCCQFIYPVHGDICHYADSSCHCRGCCPCTCVQIYRGAETGYPDPAENILGETDQCSTE